MTNRHRPPGDDDVIIEFRAVGHVVKVSAIDPRSLTEVSIIGPANESRERLKATAVAKLRYVLRKKAGGGSPPDSSLV